MLRPHLLRPDNLTPPTRTPWGGRKIVEVYKADLPLAQVRGPVGESWEISVEPSFPSSTIEGRGLADLIAADPVGWLGEQVAERFGNQTPLLVKLLDAADNLSVQVHPADSDPALADDESGKPECWIITDVEPGAGIYLGLREGAEREDVERAIATEANVSELLNFVPVRPGDVFVIDAGTIHAIGAGVTLVEPQFVRPGKRGVTYRFWDWNRKYDLRGKQDPRGQSRELHLERALRVTSFSGLKGERFVASTRPTPTLMERSEGISRTRIVDWPYFRVEHWQLDGDFDFDLPDTMVGLVCVQGHTAFSTNVGELTLSKGQSAVVPATCPRVAGTGEACTLIAVHSTLFTQ